MKQPEFRPLCSQTFCKATSVSAGNLQARSRLSPRLSF